MNARDYTLIVLDQKWLPGWRTDLLRAREPRPPADARDRALAEEIINGVIKNLFLLRHCIGHYSGKAAASIDPVVQKILAIGFYQLKFLDRIPPAAAVDRAVEQAKTFSRPRAAGFVNAVLRNYARMPAPTFPDEKSEPLLHAEIALSHPPIIFERLEKLLGADQALEFCRHDNTEPPIVLRLFPGITPADLMAAWEQLHAQHPDMPMVELSPHQSPGMMLIRSLRGGRILPHWAASGMAQVQDATAAGVVEKLRLASGMRALDRCAGLGTKTMQIRESVGDSGEVIAIDASQFRCDKLKELTTSRKLSNVRIIQTRQLSEIADQLPPSFERILVDVPCSNSGVLARRPEARYRFEIDGLVKLQREIVDDTLPWLAPGGIIVYSTCSVWPEENQLQIKNILAANPDLELIEERATLPSFGQSSPEAYHDGGYFAVLQRKPGG